MTQRKAGRHPLATRVEVRLTSAALEDLRTLHRKNPSLVVVVVAKLELIRQNPDIGSPLRGGLAGFRKLPVRNRELRIVWRVTWEADGTAIVDIAEIWAIGQRRADEVYLEMERRVRRTGGDPTTIAALEALSKFTRKRTV